MSPDETVKLNLTLVPEITEEVTIIPYLKPPFKNRLRLASQKRSLEPLRRNPVQLEIPMKNLYSGTSEVFFDIYSHDQLVTGGRALVEVGPGKLVSVYVEPHSVAIGAEELKIRLETLGFGKAQLSLNVNGKIFHEEPMILKGFETWEYYVSLGGLPPGKHYVQGALYFEDCYSDKADWFEISGKEMGKSNLSDQAEMAVDVIPMLFVEGPGEGCNWVSPESDRNSDNKIANSEGEILQIPSLSTAGILILVMLLGMCLIRIGRNR